MRRSRRHLVVGNSLFIDNRVSAKETERKQRNKLEFFAEPNAHKVY